MSTGISRRAVLQGLGAAALGAAVSPAAPAGAERAATAPCLPSARPVLEAPTVDSMRFDGPMGERLAANVRNWLLTAPAANPGMIQMFRDRDRRPPRDLLPWAGEFAGKYLISATQALRMDAGQELSNHLKHFVAELIATQADDGYLGPFHSSEKMTGNGRWDLWGQYHCMLGLLMWAKQTGDDRALAACRRCADLFCRTFLGTGNRVVMARSEEINESSAHVFALLYQETGDRRYLDFVREVERDWETPPSGDYVRAALAGKAFYQCPKPRWESLPSLQTIAELFYITGDEKYRRSFERLWWSIVEGDRHNTGGFSSGEQATGNPYDPRPIETCCTIAWTALTRDMLRLTGDSRAADELEISTWNAVLGAQGPGGRWWTYNTPMDGQRKASSHDIVFQARPGTPELNCCAVNGPRGLGVLSEWAVMKSADGLVINYYGPSALSIRGTPCGVVKIVQETGYPISGRIRLIVTPERPGPMNLRLRNPAWSARTSVVLNGRPVDNVRPGTYLAMDRTWRAGDLIELELDMSLRAWAGERDAAGKMSLYRGPILLAYDPRFDRFATPDVAPIDWQQPTEVLAPDDRNPSPILLLRCPARGGGSVTLCDFAGAGAAGNSYISWLPGAAKAMPFTRDNPWRTTTAS